MGVCHTPSQKLCCVHSYVRGSRLLLSEEKEKVFGQEPRSKGRSWLLSFRSLVGVHQHLRFRCPSETVQQGKVLVAIPFSTYEGWDASDIER